MDEEQIGFETKQEIEEYNNEFEQEIDSKLSGVGFWEKCKMFICKQSKMCLRI